MDVRPSDIDGLGLFASKRVPIGYSFQVTESFDVVGLAKYINHSDNPNGYLRFSDTGDSSFVASVVIEAGEEFTLDYWKFPDWLCRPDHPVHGWL